jgi:hypothetical protein
MHSSNVEIMAVEMYSDALAMRAAGKIFLGDINWNSLEEVQKIASIFKEELLIELTNEEIIEAAKACNYLFELGEKLNGTGNST